MNLYPVFGQEKEEVSPMLPEIISQFPTVRDFTISESQKEGCEAELEKAKELAKELGDPKKLLESIEEIRKMAERIDKI